MAAHPACIATAPTARTDFLAVDHGVPESPRARHQRHARGKCTADDATFAPSSNSPSVVQTQWHFPAT